MQTLSLGLSGLVSHISIYLKGHRTLFCIKNIKIPSNFRSLFSIIRAEALLHFSRCSWVATQKHLDITLKAPDVSLGRSSHGTLGAGLGSPEHSPAAMCGSDWKEILKKQLFGEQGLWKWISTQTIPIYKGWEWYLRGLEWLTLQP